LGSFQQEIFRNFWRRNERKEALRLQVLCREGGLQLEDNQKTLSQKRHHGKTDHKVYLLTDAAKLCFSHRATLPMTLMLPTRLTMMIYISTCQKMWRWKKNMFVSLLQIALIFSCFKFSVAGP